MPSEVDEQDPYDLLEAMFAYGAMNQPEEEEATMEGVHPMFWV